MDSWQREIEELHDYFEALFLGHTESLDRAEQALDDAFTMAGPTGATSDRSTVLAQLAAGYNHTDDLSISIQAPRLIFADEQIVVAEYIEVHELSEANRNERRTTVVFRVDETGPNGLRWLRAHETFIE